MKKSGILLITALISGVFLFGETLEMGKKGSLGIETSTTFSSDLSNGSTGLETKVGIEAIFDLFPKEDRGIIQEESDGLSVRLNVENASFSWLNTYKTTGGNYEQDDVNSWKAQPLVLSFDSLTSDIVWNNYYLRVAGTKTDMSLNSASITSIFDDVIDTDNRWYVKKKKALYYADRYNVLELPLLGEEFNRNLVEADIVDQITGQIGLGAEFDSWNANILVGSLATGEDNDDNKWAFSSDANIIPMESLEINAEIFYGINLGFDAEDTPEMYQNPFAAGLKASYMVNPQSDISFKPFIGADYLIELDSMESIWEAGGGLFVYFTKGQKKTAHMDIDIDDVINQGFSLSMNIDNENNSNLIVAYFDDTSENSLLGNFGSFLQLEVADLLSENNESPIWALVGQVEYLVDNKIKPYIRETITPEYKDIDEKTGKTGVTLYNTVAGINFNPVKNLTLNLKYERTDSPGSDSEESESDNYGIISLEFNISL